MNCRREIQIRKIMASHESESQMAVDSNPSEGRGFFLVKSQLVKSMVVQRQDSGGYFSLSSRPVKSLNFVSFNESFHLVRQDAEC